MWIALAFAAMILAYTIYAVIAPYRGRRRQSLLDSLPVEISREED